MRRTIVVAARASPLSVAQARLVMDSLRAAHPGLEVELCTVSTHGDVDQSTPLPSLGGEGVFVKGVEETVLRRKADIAVHSLKDLPCRESPGLTLAAIPPRGDARDAIFCPGWSGLDDLPEGATLGTGSPRRRAQLLFHRPDLHFVNIRGNVDTRIRKLRESGGSLHGILLAAAGLERLGLQEAITQRLPTEICLPAVGQGALAAQCRSNDPYVRGLLASLDYAPTRQATTAERAVMEALGAGCHVPAAAYGVVESDALTLDAMIASARGSRLLRLREIGPATEATTVGLRLARRLQEQGGQALLEATPA